ncbi:Hypothetical predicted protein [Podarcis lilfordi]|uniref:Uncharacterized protein n=1 Tax=Podarcis lilfordi TaxID=74358 RepID=A0AA35K5U1_9SAUR|nr:Hypothetical predicted protein [Podarcis lilfordi]
MSIFIMSKDYLDTEYGARLLHKDKIHYQNLEQENLPQTQLSAEGVCPYNLNIGLGHLRRRELPGTEETAGPADAVSLRTVPFTSSSSSSSSSSRVKALDM